MDNAYVYFDKSDDTNRYYMNCYPRGITTTDFVFIKQDFANALNNT